MSRKSSFSKIFIPQDVIQCTYVLHFFLLKKGFLFIISEQNYTQERKRKLDASILRLTIVLCRDCKCKIRSATLRTEVLVLLNRRTIVYLVTD